MEKSSYLTLGQLYGFIVFDCKIKPNYFLDEMSSDEVGYLSESYIKAYKEKWEMLRLNNHAIISSQSTKKVRPEDVLKFGWDNENKQVRTEDQNRKEIERIKKKYKLN